MLHVIMLLIVNDGYARCLGEMSTGIAEISPKNIMLLWQCAQTSVPALESSSKEEQIRSFITGERAAGQLLLVIIISLRV